MPDERGKGFDITAPALDAEALAAEVRERVRKKKESGAYDEAERTYREILSTDGPTANAARRSLGALLVFRGR